jgi:predicted metal-dependent hydrolase
MPRLDRVSRDLRCIVLGDGPVEYVLARRPRRRGVGLKVDANGLTVNAPVTLPLTRIEAFVRESERWVLKKLAEWSGKRVRAIEWRDGETLPYLGETLTLRVAVGTRNRIELGDGELHATLRDTSPVHVHRAVVAWYKRAALAHFAGRTFTLSRIAGLTPPRVFVSSARTRWGSCNARREVRLAWRLVKAPPALIDYVICHELAHLRHMNHSRAFWVEVERQCPGYRALRGELQENDHLYRAF